MQDYLNIDFYRMTGAALKNRTRLEEFCNKITAIAINDNGTVITYTDTVGKPTEFTSDVIPADWIDIEAFSQLEHFYFCQNDCNRHFKLYPNKWNKSLESIYCCNPEITKQILPFLDRFEHLNYLYLNVKGIPDFEIPDKVKKELKLLNLFDLETFTLDDKYQNLRYGRINNCSNLIFKNVDKLTELTELNLVSCHCQDLNKLKNIVQLSSLGVIKCDINNMDLCDNLTELYAIGFADNYISDVVSCSQSKAKVIELQNNLISDISPFKNNKSIVLLDLANNPINDISALCECENIQSLHLSKTYVSDISPLLKLKKLKELTIDVNKVSDVNLFKQLPNNCVINCSEFKDFIAQLNL
ncbi:MAG: hypothetical protein RR322_06310 [Oscillospiraceae bacterium]